MWTRRSNMVVHYFVGCIVRILPTGQNIQNPCVCVSLHKNITIDKDNLCCSVLSLEKLGKERCLDKPWSERQHMKRAILIIWLTTLKLWAFQIFREKVHVLHEHHQTVSMSWLPWVFIIKDWLSVQCKLSHSNGNPWSDWKAFALIQSLKKEYPLSVIWWCN